MNNIITQASRKNSTSLDSLKTAAEKSKSVIYQRKASSVSLDSEIIGTDSDEEVHKVTTTCCFASPRKQIPIGAKLPIMKVMRRSSYDASSPLTQVTPNTVSGQLFRKGSRCVPARKKSVAAGDPNALLPPLLPMDLERHCLVVDLDETLVHSSFKAIDNASFTVPVEVDDIVYTVYVMKRPHVDEFLVRIGRIFECVMFTASLSKYAEPVTSLLDPQNGAFRHRLFREHCVYTTEGCFVKDLSLLGRSLDRCAIVDNSPVSYMFQPDNAVPIVSWFGDPKDEELVNMFPLLEKMSRSESVYTVLGGTSSA